MSGSKSSLTAYLPRGLLRWALRLPIWLYRAHLGWLLGDRFLLLTHSGRKSGLLRQTVVEIVQPDRASDHYVIASGWGEKADWYKNIQKTPQVVVQVGNRRFEAVAERLTTYEAACALFMYAQAHPRAFRALGQLITGESFSATEADCEFLAGRIPLVSLHPK